MRLWLAGSALAGILAAAHPGFFTQAGRQGRGPAPVYRIEVPKSDLNVIIGAPTGTSVKLSVRGKNEPAPDLVVRDSRSRSIRVPTFRLGSGHVRELVLSDLEAGETYTYKLSQGEAKVEGRFTTARTPGTGFTFVIQADSHLDANSDLEVYRRTLGNMVEDRPDFMIDLGDTFMVDKYPDYREALKQYEAQRYWFSLPGSQMSIFLCLGNHDGEVGWPDRSGADIAAWSRTQRERLFPKIPAGSFYSGAPAKGLWYAWNWGDATFIVLDPFVATTRKTRGDEDGWNWTLGKDQFEWLERILKGSRSKYKFVFIHHLVGGFGGSEARGGVEAADRFEWGSREEFVQRRKGWADPIHALLVKHGVSAVFHGHDHLYVRQEKDGVTYLEVPQPSHRRGDSTSSAGEYGYKTGTLLGSSGHIRVIVGPEATTLDYVKSLSGPENRKVVDHYEIKAKR